MNTDRLPHLPSLAPGPRPGGLARGAAALFLIGLSLAGTALAEDLTVMKKGLGLGTIAPKSGGASGITCPTDCDESFPKGTEVKLTATAGVGSVFAGWELAGTGTTTRKVTLDANSRVRAVFELTFQRSFDDGDVNVGSDVINIASHGLIADQRAQLLTTGTLPAGLAPATTYFARPIDDDNFKLSLTAGGAAADITAATGGGTHTVLPDPAFRQRTFAAADVNTVTDAIRIASHGFAADQRVRLLTTAAALPTGLALGTTYYVQPIDSNRFTLSLTAGGAGVDITSAAGPGSHTVLPDPIPPLRAFLQKSFADADVRVAGDSIGVAAHGFVAGQRVELRTTGALPAGLSSKTSYFVRFTDADNFELALVAGGPAVDITAAAGGGTHTVVPAGATPEGLVAYLAANPNVDSPARFLHALDPEYKQNWILMSRSESLQTGTARYPRILMPSAKAEFVFTIGVTEHGSYPGSHPDAVEYMQWDPLQKNFRFHEIVLADIPGMGDIINLPGGGTRRRFPPRDRHVEIDDTKCSKCHSTRNVVNRSAFPGTSGTQAVPVQVKNKPNWDPYDSWAGMLPYNRDRIFRGSVEAAAFRKLFNLWTWRNEDPVRMVIEELELQPPGVAAQHRITRQVGGADDGHIRFGFDPPGDVVTEEPRPTKDGAMIWTRYSFNRVVGSSALTPVLRTPDLSRSLFVTLHHSDGPTNDEGRGVQLFDLLNGIDGDLNRQRVADEIVNHRFATGSVPIDVRPIALAINRPGVLTVDPSATAPMPKIRAGAGLPSLTVPLAFFDARHGMDIAALITDTTNRAFSLPRRKADFQKRNLSRTGDVYLDSTPAAGENQNGLIQEYGAGTQGLPPIDGRPAGGGLPATPNAPAVGGSDVSDRRLRQEVFRRELGSEGFYDRTKVTGETAAPGAMVDREIAGNPAKIALYRYFLEPLGVSVDKWSMGVRGRSRTYTFADVFGRFENTLAGVLTASLQTDPVIDPATRMAAVDPVTNSPYDPTNNAALLRLVNFTLSQARLPAANAVPKYTDIQRIFNKSCIECHGGLNYPPYSNRGTALDLSEDETPTGNAERLTRSYNNAVSRTTIDPLTSSLVQRVAGYNAAADRFSLIDKTDPTKSFPYRPPEHPGTNHLTDEDCPLSGFSDLMPCEGPPISQADIQTIRRWITASDPPPYTHGDPHLRTVDGVSYDFQAAGEFVLLRSPGLEVQARHTAVDTSAPLPNSHTQLTTCVSINTAVALRVGSQSIAYQPDLSGEPEGLRLWVDGALVQLGPEGIPLAAGGRIIRTSAPGGIQVDEAGGAVIVITPYWWTHRQLWYLNIDMRHVRASEGLMGAIAPGNWLPALPDGTLLGPRPADAQGRYHDLYDRLGDAWRVTETDSLFIYAPHTTPDSFRIDGWPGVGTAGACKVPPLPGGPPAQPPLEPLPQAAAEETCADIADTERKANCIKDVMLTGEVDFAGAYVLADRIARNRIPTAPVLVSPADNVTGLASSVDFRWNLTSDPDGDPIEYRLLVWHADDTPDNNNAVPVPLATAGAGRLVLCALVVLIIGCLLFVALLRMGLAGRRALLVLAVIVVLAVLAAYYLCGLTADRATLERTVSDLQSGETYYWKVIAEDGKGGAVESATRRFEVE